MTTDPNPTTPADTTTEPATADAAPEGTEPASTEPVKTSTVGDLAYKFVADTGWIRSERVLAFIAAWVTAAAGSAPWNSDGDEPAATFLAASPAGADKIGQAILAGASAVSLALTLDGLGLYRYTVAEHVSTVEADVPGALDATAPAAVEEAAAAGLAPVAPDPATRTASSALPALSTAGGGSTETVAAVQVLAAGRLGETFRANGTYDQATADLVARFQALEAIPETGQVDTATWNALLGL